MAIDRRAIAIAAAAVVALPAEGLRRVAYYDPPGILTVCYGSTGNVDPRRVYSLEECRERFDRQMGEAVDQVERCVPGLPPHVLAAFADAVYNIGPRIACDTKRSTAARMLRAGQIDAACNEITKWDKANVVGVRVALPGLTKRRALERDICLGLA